MTTEMLDLMRKQMELVHQKGFLTDTETTGASEKELEGTRAPIPGREMHDGEGKGDRITQIAWILGDEVVDEKFCPPVPVSVGSMVVTGIVPEDLSDLPVFIGSNTHSRLRDLASDPTNIFIAHNAKFDLAMIEKEGVTWTGPVLDTYRVLMHIDQDLDSHSMQFYRYNYKLYLKEPAEVAKVGKEIKPHDALGDIIVLKLLLEDLIEKGRTVEEMITLTATPVFHKRWKFGKYRGEEIIEAAKKDPGYVLYMLGMEEEKPDNKKDMDMVYTLKRVASELNLLSHVTIPFGKYKGMTVASVSSNDPGYLTWLVESESKKGPDQPKMRADLAMAIEAFS